ncbi:hypothetical protein ZHAS_00001513 [Anopheles sinensis]|uniref:Uncharacterized protein n=1 Tax=Anopheles sinensis TaxID=74873 RepID=A0A084VBE3_ANOSI|nr:hypothetical protein ZHAS_00001513 [Anopheles sinensis]
MDVRSQYPVVSLELQAIGPSVKHMCAGNVRICDLWMDKHQALKGLVR